MKFAELFAKTNGSFLEGASHPEELVLKAEELGYEALGIVDRNGVYGAPRAHVARRGKKLKLVVGVQLENESGYPIYLLARNREGYGNLCELSTQAHEDRERPRLCWETIASKSDGLLAALPITRLDEKAVPFLKSVFGEGLSLAVPRSHDGSDLDRLTAGDHFSAKFGVPAVATQEPLFHVKERKRLHDVLSCIRHNVTLSTAGFHILPNAERHLKPTAALARLYSGREAWIDRSVELAERCVFSLDEIRYRYPSEWLPPGETGDSYLEKLVWEGACRRYPGGISDAIGQAIRHELSLVSELEYADYFLTIWDIVEYARAQGILCQGRGSAANSIVCYVLGITAIDPIRLNLLFERFLSRERHEPPDIDIDFEHERREEVIQYIYRRYGRDRAAITANVICFRKKSALREVAKVLGVPEAVVLKLQVLSHRRPLAEIPRDEIAKALPDLPADTLALYLDLVQELRGFPRHLGTHVGGFVLCQDKLTRNVPVEKAAMPGRTIVQWDKNDLDALGFVRVDILGLGILTCTRKCLAVIREKYGRDLTLATIPPEDPVVYDALCRADTVGVFQIESRAQMNMLPRLLPRCFYDLVVEISLVRPGPIQGEMVHPYLRRRAGKEPVEYPHPDLRAILEKTYGVPLFQEQIMKMAMTVAGFTAGEADELRRAMGSWRKLGGNRLTPMGEKFRKGLVDRGVPQEFADRVFQQIEGFAEYGFPESHAASFALIAYATSYLKVHYPDAYLVGILNAQPMGFYSAHSLIQDAIRHQVRVLPVSVQRSLWDNDLADKNEVRLGLRQVRGLKEEVGRAVEAARAEKPFGDLVDFLGRVRTKTQALSKRDLLYLAGADAFADLGLERREALWRIPALDLPNDNLFSAPEEKVELPEESQWEKILGDYEGQGICLREHPMHFLRPEADRLQVTPSVGLKMTPSGTMVQVAGVVICRQMPGTASGVLFITLEDELGFTNLVIWNRVFEKFREVLLTQSLLWARGKLERAEGTNVVHVIVDQVKPFFAHAPALPSHDFH